MNPSKITICGGGNGAQTLAPIAALNLGCDVDLYAPLGDEAERLRAGMAAGDGLEITGAVRARARLHQVSANAAEVIPGSQVVLLVLPAFAHEATLWQIAPFLERGASVCAIPARGGFDYCAAHVLREAGREDVAIAGLQTLPWACRVEEYGRRVHVLGVKQSVTAASRPAAESARVVPFLEQMMGLPVLPASSLLSLTLANTGQIIHPGIMYGLFAQWDGTFLEQAPLFYQGLDAAGAQVLEGLSRDIQAIRIRLGERLDLSAVEPLLDWLRRAYGDAIRDPATLHGAFVSNAAYAGLQAPVREVAPGRFVPDFSSRYLAEDVPFGLVPTRAIAGLAGVDTPVVDRVIAWAGGRLGRDYLGRDIMLARIPQKYGLATLNQLVAFAAK
ncbi:MAG TPA: NAD/NADP octopine/nopaline dehydrogenase family protein [Anaerolineae bacterium]|nr:NAD/NADP octopine/nopaline dehydrogenase family protein [Anaerolineae bacterium]